jgi:hypothetical protein
MSNRDITHAIAQLRHLYGQMIRGKVVDVQQAATGLLGPALATLENECINAPDRERYFREQRRLDGKLLLLDRLADAREELAERGVAVDAAALIAELNETGEKVLAAMQEHGK